jgi:hypothetical protein
MRLSDELDSLHEARELGRTATTPKKPASKPAPRLAPKKATPDLKDPFGTRAP